MQNTSLSLVQAKVEVMKPVNMPSIVILSLLFIIVSVMTIVFSLPRRKKKLSSIDHILERLDCITRLNDGWYNDTCRKFSSRNMHKIKELFKQYYRSQKVPYIYPWNDTLHLEWHELEVSMDIYVDTLLAEINVDDDVHSVDLSSEEGWNVLLCIIDDPTSDCLQKGV